MTEPSPPGDDLTAAAPTAVPRRAASRRVRRPALAVGAALAVGLGGWLLASAGEATETPAATVRVARTVLSPAPIPTPIALPSADVFVQAEANSPFQPLIVPAPPAPPAPSGEGVPPTAAPGAPAEPGVPNDPGATAGPAEPGAPATPGVPGAPGEPPPPYEDPALGPGVTDDGTPTDPDPNPTPGAATEGEGEGDGEGAVEGEGEGEGEAPAPAPEATPGQRGTTTLTLVGVAANDRSLRLRVDGETYDLEVGDSARGFTSLSNRTEGDRQYATLQRRGGSAFELAEGSSRTVPRAGSATGK